MTELATELQALPNVSELPLLGRTEQIGQLYAAMAQVTETRYHRAVLLTGESGLGKTRLLGALEVLASQQGIAVLQGRATEAEFGRPYALWLDALRRWLERESSDETREGLVQLLQELSDPRGTAGSREELFASVASFVKRRAQAARDCLCIVLDDLHWCEPSSASLLEFVARSTRDSPVLWALAGRESELSNNAEADRFVRSLEREGVLVKSSLSPFEARTVHQLVRALGLPDDCRPSFAQSRGNPLHVIELARSLYQHERGAQPDPVDPSQREDTALGALVSGRTEGLPEPAAEVLSWASVLSDSFTVELLESLVSLSFDELARSLLLLERHALLQVEEEGCFFSHEVVRQATYAELPPSRRKLMHGQVAEQLHRVAMKDDSVAGEVVRHALLAEQYGLAAKASVLAGRRCAKSFATQEALRFAASGLRAAAQLAEAERVACCIELYEVQAMVAPPADLAAFRNELPGLSGRALELGRTGVARLGYCLLAHSRWEEGPWDAGERGSLVAAVLAPGAEPEQRIELLSETSRKLALQETELPNADALALEARSLAKGSQALPAALFDATGLLAQHRGEYGEAARAFEEARQRAESEGTPAIAFHALAHHAVLALERGNCPQALHLAEQLQQASQGFREGGEAPIALAVLALARLGLQRAAHSAETAPADDGDELSRLQAAIDALSVANAERWHLWALLGRAEHHLCQRDYEKAQASASEALRLARALARPSAQVRAHCLLGRLAHDAGDSPRAAEQRRLAGERIRYASANASACYDALCALSLGG